MTRQELTDLLLDAFDKESEAMLDRLAQELAGIDAPKKIASIIRFESRRAAAGIQRRGRTLVAAES
jgi:hypothetical protein